MSDTPESPSPFAAFSSATGFDMLEKMWRMMQIPGFGGTPSPSSMMSEMMAPMTNLDELDKRITDMRAVEQWLKLNLNLLQSAIQALEVQRATLATLKAFGAFAQSSMEQAAAGSADLRQAFGSAPEVFKAASAQAAPEPQSPPTDTNSASASAQAAPEAAAAAEPMAAIDPTPWWNLLQTQFNQIAAMALAAQPTVPATSGTGAAAKAKKSATPKANTSAKTSTKTSAQTAPKTDHKAGTQPAAKRKSAQPAKAGADRASKVAGTAASKQTPRGSARNQTTAATQAKPRGLAAGAAASLESTARSGSNWPLSDS